MKTLDRSWLWLRVEKHQEAQKDKREVLDDEKRGTQSG
ncbi:MAG: hypothetical protein MjAS7_2258 [Metallosphaera javensis (ex Sakai et al. 2022)]|nr:MAG: hypothetical protein MjAS7_2258 [Metallosphaera javensis (ex Sakai et al. 2022)]